MIAHLTNHLRKGWENSFENPMRSSKENKCIGITMAVAILASAFFTCILAKTLAFSLPLVFAATLGAMIATGAVTCTGIAFFAGFNEPKKPIS